MFSIPIIIPRIGPSNLTQGTLFPNVNDTIPTVMEVTHIQNASFLFVVF